MENKDYFNLPDDYSPTSHNLAELERLIQNKLEKDKNNKKIQDDLKDIQNNKNIYIKIQENKKKENPNNKFKQKELIILKSFLDFYKSQLNEPVHIGKDEANFYLLPRKMFNSEVNASKYLFDLESIISDKSEEPIIGLDNKKEILNYKIYKDDKYCEIDEAVEILFSFNSKFNYLENQAFSLINEKEKDFVKKVQSIEEIYFCFFKFNIKDSETPCLIFKEDINKRINEIALYFEKEVLNRLFELVKDIFEGKFKGKKIDAITNMNKFFMSFIEKCPIYSVSQVDFLM